MGSGFAVRSGVLLTAAYVIGEEHEGTLQVGEGQRRYPWRVIKRSQDHDLALLECKAPMVPLTLASSDPRIDEDVLVVGWHYKRHAWVANPGIVLGKPQREASSGQKWITPVEISDVRGFGGAPIVKFEEGHEEDEPGLAYVLSLSTIRDFLKDQDIAQGSKLLPAGSVRLAS